MVAHIRYVDMKTKIRLPEWAPKVFKVHNNVRRFEPISGEMSETKVACLELLYTRHFR